MSQTRNYFTALKKKIDETSLQEAIANGFEINSDDGANTLLIHYAGKGDVEAVNLLLKHKANIDLRPSNYTALMQAIQYNKPDVVEALIRHNVDITIRDTEDYSPLNLALRKKNFVIAKMLVNHKNVINTFYKKDRKREHKYLLHEFIIHHSDLNVIRFLLENRANPLAENGDGDTPLRLAIHTNQNSVAELLFEFGAQSRNEREATEMFYHAISHENLEIAKVLMQNGVDITTPLESGKTIFDNLLTRHDCENKKCVITMMLKVLNEMKEPLQIDKIQALLHYLAGCNQRDPAVLTGYKALLGHFKKYKLPLDELPDIETYIRKLTLFQQMKQQVYANILTKIKPNGGFPSQSSELSKQGRFDYSNIFHHIKDKADKSHASYNDLMVKIVKMSGVASKGMNDYEDVDDFYYALGRCIKRDLNRSIDQLSMEEIISYCCGTLDERMQQLNASSPSESSSKRKNTRGS